MNTAQRVFLNTAVQIVARGFGLVVSLVVLRLTAGYLGVQAFGQLSIIIALSELLRVLADFGVGTTLAREIAKSPGEADRLGGDLIVVRLVASALAVFLALAMIPLLPYSHETKVGLALGLAGMFCMSVGTFPNAFFQTRLRLELQAALDMATKVLNLGGILLVRALSLGFYGVVGSFVIVNALICVLAFVLSRRFWRLNFTFDWSRVRVLTRDAVGIGAVSMVGLLHFKGDAILLSFLKPAKDVGIYSVAYRFIDQAFFLPGVFMAAMFPILTRAIHSGTVAGEFAINRSFRVLLLGGVAVTVMAFVAARPFVHLISSTQFDEAVTPLRILAFAIPFIFVGPVFYNAVIAVNRQRELIVIGIVALTFNVLLNLVLIPRYSYKGAAIATVISEAFSCMASFAIAKRWIAFRIDRMFLIRALVATAATAGVVELTSDGSPWVVLAGAEAAFAVSAYGVGAVTRADLASVLKRVSTT